MGFQTGFVFPRGGLLPSEPTIGDGILYRPLVVSTGHAMLSWQLGERIGVS